MKYLNPFYRDKKIEVADKYCWYINSDDADIIIDIIDKFKSQISFKYRRKINKLYDEIENSITWDIDLRYIGLYFYYDKKKGFSLWFVEDDDDKKTAERHISEYNYIYKGELKLVDNKLILDELDMDVKKYNL